MLEIVPDPPVRPRGRVGWRELLVHELFDRDASKSEGKSYCRYCGDFLGCPCGYIDPSGRETTMATIDHDVPIMRGGHDRLDNLQLLCRFCNSRKGSLTGNEYRDVLADRRAWEQGEDS